MEQAEAAKEVLGSSDDIRSFIVDRGAAPQFFSLRVQLPSQGRTDSKLAATDKMWALIKTYASGGENELHAHPNEDHLFIVVQGVARFYGPKNEEWDVGKNNGVLLPRGCFYWFKVVSSEPLVMVRVGCVANSGSDPAHRIDIHGKEMDGYSTENKYGTVVMSNRYFE